MRGRFAATIAFVVASVIAQPVSAAQARVIEIRPSSVDPGVKAFDDPSFALMPDDVAPDAPLAIFLPGTGGRPRASADILAVIAGQGYRVLALEYDDVPAVSQVCPKDPDPDCSEAFRAMRVEGTGTTTVVRNPPAEAIVARLTAALRALDHDHPDNGWGRYLDGTAIRWDRIVVSGLSQGAGMAAYIAKHHAVRRVVLFSSPWDVTGADHRPAPWLSMAGSTPTDRWFAEYHAKEVTADLIRHAYVALQIPADHIRVFDRELESTPGRSSNPYHGSTIRDVGYADEWRFLFGRADDALSR